MKEKGLHAVLVGIVRGQQPSVIAKKLFDVPQMQECIAKHILKLINTECMNMCKVKDPSYRGGSSDFPKFPINCIWAITQSTNIDTHF